MKAQITKTVFLILFLFMTGVGCEKNEDNNHKSIVGKWQLIRCPDGCIGFGNIMIEITADSVFNRYIDGYLEFTSEFNIKPGLMGFDTIVFQNQESTYEYELIAMTSSEKLHLIPPILTLTATCDIYKRKKYKK